MAAIRSFLLALIATITVAATASPTQVSDYFEVDACLRFQGSQHELDEWGQSAWEHYSKKLGDVGRTPKKFKWLYRPSTPSVSSECLTRLT